MYISCTDNMSISVGKTRWNVKAILIFDIYFDFRNGLEALPSLFNFLFCVAIFA